VSRVTLTVHGPTTVASPVIHAGPRPTIVMPRDFCVTGHTSRVTPTTHGSQPIRAMSRVTPHAHVPHVTGGEDIVTGVSGDGRAGSRITHLDDQGCVRCFIDVSAGFFDRSECLVS
jgi:hypothetical protein